MKRNNIHRAALPQPLPVRHEVRKEFTQAVRDDSLSQADSARASGDVPGLGIVQLDASDSDSVRSPGAAETNDEMDEMDEMLDKDDPASSADERIGRRDPASSADEKLFSVDDPSSSGDVRLLDHVRDLSEPELVDPDLNMGLHQPSISGRLIAGQNLT